MNIEINVIMLKSEGNFAFPLYCMGIFPKKYPGNTSPEAANPIPTKHKSIKPPVLPIVKPPILLVVVDPTPLTAESISTDSTP